MLYYSYFTSLWSVRNIFTCSNVDVLIKGKLSGYSADLEWFYSNVEELSKGA